MSEKKLQDTIAITESEVPESRVSDFSQSSWFSFLPMILIFFVMYFLVVRPQEKKQKEHSKLVKTIKVGERVLLNSGIFGVVVRAQDENEYIHVQVAENSIITILRSSVSDVLSRKEDIKLPEFFVVGTKTAQAPKKTTKKSQEEKIEK